MGASRLKVQTGSTQFGITSTVCHVCRASIEAMKALAALTDGSLPNQDRALQAGAPALLCTAAQAAMQSGPATDAEIACEPCFSTPFSSLPPIVARPVALFRLLTDLCVPMFQKMEGMLSTFMWLPVQSCSGFGALAILHVCDCITV